MEDHDLIAGRIATIRGFVAIHFPNGTKDDFPHGTCHRFRVLEPGRSKLLDVTDLFLTVHKTHLNIDELIEREGVLELMQQATAEQRVVCSADRGAFIDDRVN